MMRQYLETKARYPDAILFFRLGDFYEMFFEDAVTASEALQITLTSRVKGDDKVPMCGVPYHAARGYVAKLLEKGLQGRHLRPGGGARASAPSSSGAR